MRIFLIRHGDADDSLTRDGREQIAKTTEFLKSLGLDSRSVVLLSSPLQRAVETAALIRDGLAIAEIVQKSWLASDSEEGAFGLLKRFVVDNKDLSAVIVVMHMPEMDGILGYLDSPFRARNGSVHEIFLPPTRTPIQLFVP